MKRHRRYVVYVQAFPLLNRRPVLGVVAVHPDTPVPARRQDLVRDPYDGRDVLASDDRQLTHHAAVVEVPYSHYALFSRRIQPTMSYQ